MTTAAPTLRYDDPDWSGTPNGDIFLEIIKNGVSLGRTAKLEKSRNLIGRLPLCDIELEHPSVSRYHAIIQFRNDGRGFLYDLGSPHGTYLNKNRIASKQFTPLSAGDMIKFGASTRIFVFNCPPPQVSVQDTGSIDWEVTVLDDHDGWKGNKIVQRVLILR
jgi:pSer/pThr/pTyr-binding forkhead associated (FHA) protein